MPEDEFEAQPAPVPAQLGDGVPSPVHQHYTPLSLANAFIARYGGATGIQHMKLQKLVYYTHAWWLSHYSEPFLTERPQVWKYGPVFSGLYQDLRGFGSRPISTPQAETPFDQPDVLQDENIDNLIDWIWQHYGSYTGVELSERTHAPGTPWRIIAERHNFLVPRHIPIDDQTIRDCFRQDPAMVLERQ